MNITDTLLGGLDVSIEPFAVCDVRAGRYMDLQADASVAIHYVLSGTGKLTTARGDMVDLAADQMILVPKGLSHRIESNAPITQSDYSASSDCLQPSESLAWLKAGEGNTDVVLACGRIKATYGNEVDIFNLLDQPLEESFSEMAHIRGAFQAMLQELCNPQLGTLALTSTLMKQCLILFLRRIQERQDSRIPWLAVLNNRGLQLALQAIISEPAKQFSVEDLAEIAAMSRSTFSEQFSKALGQSPHVFLRTYRLQSAARLLSCTDKPVESVASQVGFSSRSSFSRAFKSVYGCDPATYRKTDS
jgi:AraC-like DNA-binding protein